MQGDYMPLWEKCQWENNSFLKEKKKFHFSGKTLPINPPGGLRQGGI